MVALRFTEWGRATGRYTAKLRLSAYGERLVTVAYGLLALGLVLGWSALFLRGSTWTAVLVRIIWIIALALLAAVSGEPRAAAAGAITGALAHLMLQLGLEGRRA